MADTGPESWLVVDLSNGIPGAYATKMLLDAGARVVKVESPVGDPLRGWTSTGHALEDQDGALFQFLAGGKESVTVDISSAEDTGFLERLILGADIVVWTPDCVVSDLARFAPESMRCWAPAASIVALTPFGLTGPWADRPATELTLQAWSGGAGRGTPEEAPRSIGGYLGEWLGGMFAAVSAMISRYGRTASHTGELVDLSLLECLVLCQWNHEVTYFELAKRPWHPRRAINIPDIEPTADGYVGIMIVTSQMWEDFCILVEHPEWLEDPSLYSYAGRLARAEELTAAIQEWTLARTTDEVVELAGLFRIPVAPVGTGQTIPGFDHFIDRGMYARNPGGGFLQPSPPYRLDGQVGWIPLAAPSLGQHDEAVRAGSRDAAGGLSLDQPEGLPFAGLRILDFTAFWAGPIAANVMGMFGAEVIHVESVSRPDGFRGHTVLTAEDDEWWEWTPAFHASNTNKLGITLDMSSAEGRALAERLIAQADVVIENYSPRVMENWGFGYDDLKALNPELVMLRMPAFGLTGPWRDRTGFAQTMEQISGMAQLTGFEGGKPTTLNGPCDPISGMHAAAALLVALEKRRRTGKGLLVESIMVASALNVAAELVIAESAYGTALARRGNRGYRNEFQDLFECADVDSAGDSRWVAVAAVEPSQLQLLASVVGVELDVRGMAELLADESDGAVGTRLRAAVAQWCGSRSSDEVLKVLGEVDLPAAKALSPHEVGSVEQLHARGFFERVSHPVVGDETIAGFPARFSSGPHKVHRTAAPTLGQDNARVLGGTLGLDEDDLGRLKEAGVIGTRIQGTFRSR